ncbi:hypothetical protein [Thiocapsa imhoffii]|uniref:hypothetical protein n=1 Tax=Thiocapsa imhoffii TaxID=382777 RepID=UPI0019041DC1|nr:hypothetical protein [Thiocapsa imhoffii]
MVVTNENDADGGDLGPLHCAIVTAGYRLIGWLKDQTTSAIQPKRKLPVSVAGQRVWMAREQCRYPHDSLQVSQPGAQLARSGEAEAFLLLTLVRAKSLKVLVREYDLHAPS